MDEVTSWGGRRRFVRFPWRLYRDDARWAPPLLNERMAVLTPQRNPALADVELVLFLAEASGPGFLDEAVGTIAAWIDRGALASGNRRVAWFGYLETINNAEIAAKLIEAAETWAFEQLPGLQAIRGPVAPDPRWLAGLLSDGFDQRPVAYLPYNHPYLPELLEAPGYTVAETWRTYETTLAALVSLTQADRETVSHTKWGAAADGNVGRVGNPSYDLIPGAEFTVRAASEADAPDLAALRVALPRAAGTSAWHGKPPFAAVAQIAGRIVAVAAAQPDLSRALRFANGRWFPAGWLADRLIPPAACRVHLWQPAVMVEWAGMGIESLLWGELAGQAMRAGYRKAIVGPVPAVDGALVAALEAAGARPAQTFCTYEKDFNTGGQRSDENSSMLW